MSSTGGSPLTEDNSQVQKENDTLPSRVLNSDNPNGTEAVAAEGSFVIWDKIPHWFIPTVGLIYATGFLIIITFFDRYGLRESSGDFFKVKYLHAGILYWLLPLIVLAPLYGFYLLKQFSKEKPAEGEDLFRAYIPSALLITNLLFVFYVFAVFSPPGSVAQRESVIPVMFLVTIGGIILTRVFTRILIREGLSPKAGDDIVLYGRWILCVGIIFGLDWYALGGGLLKLLWHILLDGGWIFFAFLLTGAFLAERTRVRSKQFSGFRAKLTLKVLSGGLIIATFYLSVLAFALRIYPYIPVPKGGGDYVGSPNVVLCFQGANEKLALPELVGTTQNDCIRSKELQIIEESATSIFVADPNDAGGPQSWRTGKKPMVYEIRRDKVGTITYLNPH
jgi:hypothetical protein